MKDLYAVLGLAKGANDAEIKKAYRKLAKELHPDRNKGDAKVVDRFKEVTAAYDILGDKDKRAKYDAGQIDAEGKERAYGHDFSGGRGPQGASHYEFTGSPEDLFQEIFGGGFGRGGDDIFGETLRSNGRRRSGQIRRGANITYTMTVDFLEAAKGGERKIQLGEKMLVVKIPAGIREGQQIRLTGQGEAGRFGGPPGDALISVSIRSHPFYKREENDILLDLPISLSEAVLGAKVKVPTIHGAVSLNVPKGSSSGKTLRLKGKGIAAKGKTPGDQLVKLEIILPDDTDGALAKTIENWSRTHGYNPRAKMGLD